MNALIPSNAMILASAGTGKTFELSTRYIRLLIGGVHPKSILATTFTRKAAGEILDRIVLRLAGAANDPEVADVTARELGVSGITQSRFAELLRMLIQNLNNLQVETLDAFFYRVARAFSLDIGMPPGWTIGEETEIRGISNRAALRSLSRRAIVDIVYDLAKGEAKRGVGAMVRQTVDDLYKIFRETNDQDQLDAWSRLQPKSLMTLDRIDELCRQIQDLDFEGTSSFNQKMEADLAKIANRDWDGLLDKGPFSKVAAGADSFSRMKIPPELLNLMTPIAEHAIATNIHQLVRQTEGALEFLKLYHHEFLRQKQEHGILEYEDVNYLAARLFSRYSFARLAWRLDQNIDHLLLDEFQDTSVQQWQVLRPLAQRVCQSGGQRSFFCVGDVKQAIYGWRGGVAEIFDDVRNEFADQLDDVQSRSKSYRSSQVVIDAINEIFSKLGQSPAIEDQRHFYESWLEKFETHSTEKKERKGYATFEISEDSGSHLAYAANRIRELVQRHPNRQIGVLVRKNEQVAKLIFELSRIGVHASEEGGNPLTDSAGVNLLLSALRLVDHPDDKLSRFHLLHSPLAESFQLTQENLMHDHHPVRRIAQEMRLKLLDVGYGDLLADWAGILESHCTRREWFRVGQLIEKGYSISAADHLRTNDLIRWVESQKVADPSAAQVNVMTIHKSKGLEFDIVVLPELKFDRGRPPNYIVGRDSPTQPVKLVCRYMKELNHQQLPLEFQQAFEDQIRGSIHEMMCNLYVAVTRARHALHMIVPPSCNAGQINAAALVMYALGVTHHHKKDPQPGTVAWQAGDENWDDLEEDQSQPASEHALGPIDWQPPKTTRNRPWETPSSREGGDQVHLGRLLQLQDNHDARLTGSLIHACFETITWLEDGQPDDDLLVERLRQVEGADDERIRSAIHEFRRILNQPNTARALRRDPYGEDLFQLYRRVEVHNERPFTVRLEGSVVNGVIDRLILMGDDNGWVAADIVDFKTDELSAGDQQALHNRVDVYRPQILTYRQAVSAIYNLKSNDVSSRLLFVAIDLLVPVD